jgi:hypothetical protein
MNPPGSGDLMREALAYLKGLDAASGLSSEELNQTALHKMAWLLSGLLDEVAELRRRQEALEERLQQISAAHPADGPRKQIGAIIPLNAESEYEDSRHDRAPALYCPACHRQLPIVAAMWERETFQVACAHCSLTVEVR